LQVTGHEAVKAFGELKVKLHSVIATLHSMSGPLHVPAALPSRE